MKSTSDLKFKLLSKESLYSGFFQLKRYQIQHQLYQGGWSEPFYRELFARGEAAAVVLLDPKRHELLMVEQFRPGAMKSHQSPWLLELVAGIIESNENPEAVARREAMEEAGCTITRLSKICDYWVSPGGSDEKIHLYLGEIDIQTIHQFGGLIEEHEDIKLHKIPVEQAFSLLETGKINNALSIIGLQWLKLNWQHRAHFWTEMYEKGHNLSE